MTNTKLEVKLVDLETGKEIVRNANADELAQIEIDEANYKTKAAAAKAKETAKAAILDRIGLTTDELKTILG
jgi:hypothetical protein